jgi:DNA-binding transcriptional ArsR family regulator
VVASVEPGDGGGVQAVLDALASPVRREILWLTWREELPAGQIAVACGLSAPTVSRHLTILREAGLVTLRADGTSRRYRARHAVLHGLQAMVLGETSKWTPPDDLPERDQAAAATVSAVVASADLDCDRQTVFAALTDPDLCSRWLGVPIDVTAGRFAARMEWGTHVRGWYEHVVAPGLIVMVWDFDDDRVPLPGHELSAYIQITATGSGSRVQVLQQVDSPEQAAFMQSAWAMFLGRLVQELPAALASPRPVLRPARAKHAPGSSGPPGSRT